MAELQLPVTVEYVSTRAANEVQVRLVNGDYRKQIKDHHGVTAIFFLFLSMTGMFAAATAGRMGLLLVIAAGTVAIGKKLWTEYESALQALNNAIERGVGNCVRTEINDRGFVGHNQGFECFCPWSAMQTYCIRDSVLLVELTNGLWFIIPSATLKPEAVTLQGLEQILVQNGVHQRT